MGKIRLERGQILLRAGKMAVYPLVLFIAIAIFPSSADMKLAGSRAFPYDQQPRSLTLVWPAIAMQQNTEGGSIAVSNRLQTYLQVALVVILCLLLLSATILYSLSRKRREQLKIADSPEVSVQPMWTFAVETNVSGNTGFQADHILEHDTNHSAPAREQTLAEQHRQPDGFPSSGSDLSLIPRDEFEQTGKNINKVLDALSTGVRGRQGETAGRDEIRIFCTVHRVGFNVMRSGRDILCPLGPHLLAQNFPYGANLVFCCDCRRFSLASASEESSSKACPSCDRPMVRMYLCDRCHVLSTESRTLTGNRYEITDKGISPFCPGCLSSPPAKLWNHQCAPVEAELLSAFQPCQWCEQAPPI